MSEMSAAFNERFDAGQAAQAAFRYHARPLPQIEPVDGAFTS
jgi:hypothetical protein